MLKIFTVYDSKTEAYLPPFYAQATGAGLRIFIEAAGTAEHQFHKHAGDYTLFEIGEWDELRGELMPNMANINLGTALQLQEKPLTPVVQGGE